MRAALIVVALLAACHPAPTRVPGDSISLAAWDRARAIADQHVRDRGDGWLFNGGPAEARYGVPFLFVYVMHTSVLVHRGAVVTARGTEALQQFLEDTDVLERQVADAQDLAHLLYALEVPLPAGSHSDLILRDDAPVPLRPTVRHHGRQTELSYFAPPDSAVAGREWGAPRGPDVDLDEWILRLERGHAPAWLHRLRSYNRFDQRFNDYVAD
jgi:hypothetical protein